MGSSFAGSSAISGKGAFSQLSNWWARIQGVKLPYGRADRAISNTQKTTASQLRQYEADLERREGALQRSLNATPQLPDVEAPGSAVGMSDIEKRVKKLKAQEKQIGGL
jgi:hypothetical protein